MIGHEEWVGADGYGESDVVRHAPDDGSYYRPDSSQLGKMRGSKVGAFALVPSARVDGTSKGFSAEDAGVIHVDPHAPDGGVVVDMSTLRRSELNQAMAAATYPHETYYALGSPARLKRPASGPAEERQEYSPPQAQQAPRPPQQEPVLSQPTQPTPMPMPFPQQQPQPAYYPAPAPMPMPDQTQAMVMQLANAVNGLSQQMQQMKAEREAPEPLRVRSAPAKLRGPLPLPTGSPVRYSPPKREESEEEDDDFEANLKPINRKPARRDEDEEAEEEDTGSVVRHQSRKQRVKDYEEQQRGDGEAVITGFETLKIKFVAGPIAQRPKRKVFFEFPQTGRQSAGYHEVIESDHCLILVYDTRYEDGTQYMPPDRGEEKLDVHVPHLKKQFSVSSMGFVYALGVLDFIVLVKHSVEEVDSQGD